jgi:hypothetical protein
MRRLTAIGLAMALIYTTYGFACSRQSMLGAARDVVSALNDISPLLQQAGVSTAKLTQAISIANQLVTSFENNQDADTVALTSSLITAFNALAAESELITNQHTRTLVIVSLGIANVALHYIANHVERTASGRLGANHVIPRFNKQKVWACRDAQSGQYRKMSYCRAHPDVTVVETR